MARAATSVGQILDFPKLKRFSVSLFANVFIMLRLCFLTNCNAMRDNFQYKISSQEMAKASLAELVRRLLRVEGVSQAGGLPAAGRHCVAGRQKVCRKREKAWLDLAPAGRSMSWWQRQRPLALFTAEAPTAKPTFMTRADASCRAAAGCSASCRAASGCNASCRPRLLGH
jgi:hypothetical protein